MGNSASTAAPAEEPLLGNEEVVSPHLREALIWERKNRNPLKYYEVVAILGQGSMGSVSKVKKRGHAMGGSSRDRYVKAEQGHLGLKIQICLAWCCGDEEEEGDLHSRTILEEIPTGEIPTSSSSIVQFRGINPTYYAMKSLDLRKAKDPMYVEELKNEVEILKTVDHPHIIRAMETCQYETNLYLIMELCSGGDLYVRDPYSEVQAARITSCILSAVGYMHSKNIIHRDLKFENIMYTTSRPDADVKVIDFGLSKKYGNDPLKETAGTVYTMSPEVFDGNYSYKVDLWSVGVICYMLLSSAMPFFAETRVGVVALIRLGKYSFKGRRWARVSQDAKDFVRSLLTVDPEKRPTAEEALKSPFLSKAEEFYKQNSLRSRTLAMNLVQATMEQYASYSTLKKLALVVIAHKSTSEEVGFLRSMFENYDRSHLGVVNLEEFKDALKDYDYTNEEAERLFRALDIDHTGELHYYEFLAATIEAHGEITEQRLADAFDRLDCDDSGYITVDNVRQFLGDAAPQSYLDRVVSEADQDPDMKIHYDEFLQLWSVDDDEKRLEYLDKVSHRRGDTANGNGAVNYRSSLQELREELSSMSLNLARSRSIEEVADQVEEALPGSRVFLANKKSSIRSLSNSNRRGEFV